MVDFKIVDAKEKDIEILTSMKLVTMIDDEMDKKLSYTEKKKFKNTIISSIEVAYKDYKMIYLDKVCIGAYLLVPYLDGIMIDQIYLFEEYRNKGIGSKIISKILKKCRKLYIWVYASNKKALNLFLRLGFDIVSNSKRTIILKYDSIYIGVINHMNDIVVGYRDKNDNKYIDFTDSFREDYYLQSPKQLLESKIGICFDQVELERELFSKTNVEFRTYFINYGNEEAAHSFLVYKDDNKYYWFENAWVKYKGIHEYDSKEELFKDVSYKFVNTIKDGDINRVKLYVYDKPRYGINYNKFISNIICNKCIKY